MRVPLHWGGVLLCKFKSSQCSKILGLLFVLLCCHSARAQEDTKATTEQIIRSAFIYNFALYTSWPESKLQEFNYEIRVCTLGTDVLGEAIESIRKKTIRNKAVQLLKNVSLEVVNECHVLYVSGVSNDTMLKLYKLSMQHHILLISEHASDRPMRGMITMRVEQNHLMFDVDYTYAKLANLNFSSRLLNLAREVY